MAQLYWDLDGGFTPEAWLLPSWLPLPSFRCETFKFVNISKKKNKFKFAMSRLH